MSIMDRGKKVFSREEVVSLLAALVSLVHMEVKDPPVPPDDETQGIKDRYNPLFIRGMLEGIVLVINELNIIEDVKKVVKGLTGGKT